MWLLKSSKEIIVPHGLHLIRKNLGVELSTWTEALLYWNQASSLQETCSSLTTSLTKDIKFKRIFIVNKLLSNSIRTSLKHCHPQWGTQYSSIEARTLNRQQPLPNWMRAEQTILSVVERSQTNLTTTLSSLLGPLTVISLRKIRRQWDLSLTFQRINKYSLWFKVIKQACNLTSNPILIALLRMRGPI
jgi:hypothetical protein